MNLTRFEVFMSAMAAVVILVGFMGGVIRWFFRFVNALDDNTQANARLSKAFETFSARIDITLGDLEKRVTILETWARGRTWL